MAALTIALFLGQDLATQYADLKSEGVLERKESLNYRDKSEVYSFLDARFIVQKKSGVVVSIFIDASKIPPLA